MTISKHRNGFIPIAVILLIVIASATVSGGVFYYVGKKSRVAEIPANTTIPTPTANEPSISNPPEDQIVSPTPIPLPPQSPKPTTEKTIPPTKSAEPQKTSQPSPQSQPAPTTSAVSFEVTIDPGVRLSGGAIPYVLKLKDGGYRMYYCGMSAPGILSAISSDGLEFIKESGVRLSPVGGNESVVCDPTLVDLPDGRVRMYYKGGTGGGGGGPSESIHRIYSAVSNDGLNFQREGLVVDSEISGDGGFASVPAAIRLPDSRVRLYYVSNSSYVGHGVVSRISSDGINFTPESTKVAAFVDPEITTLPNQRVLLVASTIPVLPKGIKAPVPAGIYAFVSSDGINFGDPIKLVADGKIWIDPAIIKTGEKTYRLYYWSPNENPNLIHSATLRLK